MTLPVVGGVSALALLECTLVALPDESAFRRLERWRSPAWVALLPGMILIGTFGVLLLPGTALALVILAVVTTPALAATSVLAVVRVRRPVPGRRATLLAGVAVLAALAVFAGGWLAQLSQSILTGLACLSVGVGMVRLMPRRLVPVGVVTMCAVDVALLALGPGMAAYGALGNAADRFRGPGFDHATIGTVTLDYPDLVLAAVLGGMLARDRFAQRRAAVLLLALAGLYGLLVAYLAVIPATVPIALTYFAVRRGRRPGGPRGHHVARRCFGKAGAAFTRVRVRASEAIAVATSRR